MLFEGTYRRRKKWWQLWLRLKRKPWLVFDPDQRRVSISGVREVHIQNGELILICKSNTHNSGEKVSFMLKEFERVAFGER